MVPHKPPTQCLHQPDQQSLITWLHTGAQQHHQELFHTASSICQNQYGRISGPSANMPPAHDKCPMSTQTYSDRSQALTRATVTKLEQSSTVWLKACSETSARALTWQWDVDCEPLPPSSPGLLQLAAARPHSILVHVDEEHTVIIIKQVAGAVACSQDRQD